MRHRVRGKKLNRDIHHRKALFKNLINSLILHEEIQTTETKAKAIKGLVDKLISKGRQGTLHARRLIGGFLQNKAAVSKIVDELGPRFKQRPSGFTRIIRVGQRRGDAAQMVKMELTEKKEKKEVSKEGKKEKTSENKAKKEPRQKTSKS